MYPTSGFFPFLTAECGADTAGPPAHSSGRQLPVRPALNAPVPTLLVFV